MPEEVPMLPRQQPYQPPMPQGQPTVVDVPTISAAPAPMEVKVAHRWRNMPQTTATVVGSIIFISGGLNMAQGVGWNLDFMMGDQFNISWFIAVIAATLVSLPLLRITTMKMIMGFASLLILIGGILFISGPEEYNTVLTGRYLNGIAIGLIIVPFIKNASEIADVAHRGTCLGMEQFSMSLGIAIQMNYPFIGITSYDFPANRLHGILDLICAFLAAALLVTIVESPIEQIRKDNNSAALKTIASLRSPPLCPNEFETLLEQHKTYVKEEEQLTLLASFRRATTPLLKLLLVRSMLVVFCCSITLNMGMMHNSFRMDYTWAPLGMVICRVLGGVIAICMVDNVNRKFASILPVAVIGCLLIVLGYNSPRGKHEPYNKDMEDYVDETMYDNTNDERWLPYYLYMCLQLFTGFFVPYTSVYLGEAFPLRIKPILIALIVTMEQLLHIIFIETLDVIIGNTLIIQGIISVVVFFLCVAMIPETRNTTLSEAQKRFRTLITFR
uniref:Major facilitator superfamily (MFS) profile domain-containing protein n=2 Tax=Stomoxys calcitrans TaxID=35570 RepID=A0A1I8NW31_STOCA